VISLARMDDHAPVQLGAHADDLSGPGAHQVRRVVAQYLALIGGEHAPARLPCHG
jgi:hypothetical protein